MLHSRYALSFPLVLVFFLMLITFWLKRSLDQSTVEYEQTAPHVVDSFAEGISVYKLSNQGQREYTLDATKMTHYADEDTYRLTAPVFTAASDSERSRVTARTANSNKARTHIDMFGDVHVQQNKPNQAEMLAVTEQLTLLPDKKLAYSAVPTKITQGKSYITGQQIQLDWGKKYAVASGGVSGWIYQEDRHE